MGCGSSNTSSPQTQNVTIKVSLPSSLQKRFLKITQKPNVDIVTVKLDVNSSDHIYMQNATMNKIISKSGNYWMIVTKPLPIDTPLSFIAKAYNGTEALVFRGSYYGAIDDKISDITLSLVSDNTIIEPRASLRSIVFNNHEKTDITFNIYNPNGDDLNYKIFSSLGSFTPNKGVLNFNSTLQFHSLNVTFTPTATVSNCHFLLTNSDGEQFTTSFTIQTTSQPSELKLKALYSQKSQLYAIERNETVKLLNTNLQLVKNKNAITKPVIMGNSAYFSAYNETYGYEIYKSDGTKEGTTIVKDINPNNNYYTPLKLTTISNRLYFSADDGVYGKELWRSDGSSNETVMVKDINPNGSSYPNELINLNGILFFSATDQTHSTELWKSDGTSDGTTMVKDINPNGNADVTYLTNVNGIVYFRAKDDTHGLELWRSDGSESGTYMVKDAVVNGDFDISHLISLNGILYFARNNGNNGVELWRSDGTNNGTQIVKVLNSSSNASMDTMIKMDNILYFNVKGSDSQELLWRSDGSKSGTYSIATINSTLNHFSTPLTGVNHTLYFRAKDDYGYELWKSNGTEGNARMVKDINPDGHSFPTYLTDVDNLLYFVANDGGGNNELWRSNGTKERTVKVTLDE